MQEEPFSKIDKIDVAIIQNLSEDARQSRSKLARKLRISKSTLLYRITKLEAGVISHYTTIVDHSMSGNMYVRVAVRGSVKRAPYMTFYATTHGMYDVVFAFYAQTLIEAQRIIDTIRPHVDIMHISFALQFYTCFPKAYSLALAPVRTSFSQERGELTSMQTGILKELEQRPQISLQDISRSLSIATKTVMANKRKLEKLGVIRKYSVTLNPEAFGFEQAHIYWSDGAQTASLMNYLLSHPRVVYVTAAFGGKLEAEYLFETHKALHRFFAEIKHKFGIQMEAYFVYD